MSINNPPTDPTLDPVTGIPLDASYATQYQVPLGSQPINLDELNAQGKQGNWLYPDNLPPVVARLQARDLTNPGNAQDLSTDGKRNLNVNIAASAVPSGGGSNWVYLTGRQENSPVGTGLQPFDVIKPAPTKLYQFNGCAYADVFNTGGGGAVNDAFTIGYSDYNNPGLYPLYTDIMSFDPTYNPTCFPFVRWSFIWPEGLPMLGTYDNANPFLIWTQSPTIHVIVTYSMLYA